MEEIKLSDINLLDVGNEIQIAGTIWSGKGMAFVTLFPGKQEDLSHLTTLPMDLQEWEQFLRQTDLLETEIFRTDPSGKIIKAIVRKTQRAIDGYMQWAVFKRDNYTCRYCGRTGIPLTVDHVDLWENGGATIEANLVSACKNCNKERGRMEYPDWINSKQYEKRSKGLKIDVLHQNRRLVSELPNLQALRVTNIRTR